MRLILLEMYIWRYYCYLLLLRRFGRVIYTGLPEERDRQLAHSLLFASILAFILVPNFLRARAGGGGPLIASTVCIFLLTGKCGSHQRRA